MNNIISCSLYTVQIYYQFQRDCTFIMPLACTDMQLLSLHPPVRILSVITYFFPGIHMACSCDSHWFYLDVIYSFPKLFQCEMDLLALVPRRNQPNDIPVWFNVSGVVILSCFFFLPEIVCWANQSLSSVLSSPGGKPLRSSKVSLDMTDWPHPHSFHLTYMERSTEWWEGTRLPNNISIKR